MRIGGPGSASCLGRHSITFLPLEGEVARRAGGGKGMPVLRSKVTGDMYVQVEAETPKNLTRRQRELLEEFEKESHRETSPESAGFFSRVKDFFEGKGG